MAEAGPRRGHGRASHPGLGSGGPLDGQSRPRRPEVGAAGALPAEKPSGLFPAEERPLAAGGEPRGGGRRGWGGRRAGRVGPVSPG